jgi:hypothetical protein
MGIVKERWGRYEGGDTMFLGERDIVGNEWMDKWRLARRRMACFFLNVGRASEVVLCAW